MAKGTRPGIFSGFLTAMMVLPFIFFLVGALPETAFCQEPTVYPSSVDPYEVIVYEHYNFVGRYLRFKLLPAMRQLLVPDLPKDMNDRISSIQVGSKVGVFVFLGSNFKSGFLSNIIRQSIEKLTYNDVISSLIVFPIEWGAPLGVMLQDLHQGDLIHSFRFFPLSQDANNIEEKYYALGDMDDDVNRIQFHPYGESPVYGKVQVTLYEHPSFMGRWITLPGADGSIPDRGLIRMNTFQFDDIASSMIVRWIGPPPPLQVQVVLPPPPPPPSTKARVSAPTAPDTAQDTSGRTPPPPGSQTAKAPPDKTPPAPPAAIAPNAGISGQWDSNIGAVYEIQQSGNNFTWSAPSLSQSGTGTVSGNTVTLSGPGWTVRGVITDTDASGKPAKIVGENGIVLFRTPGDQPADVKPPAQQSVPSAPPAPAVAVNTLSGPWNSNIGAVYEIQQSGNNFTWSAPSLNQSGTGTVSGNIVTLSGPGWTVKGIITEADNSGRPTKIVGENGVVLFRSAPGKS